ncbi:hypothetical protein CPC08DRAFT_477156 [Agrocybe pediades]|nr:hypothetical protein CPC08DRAFT_477156 [Agrocybe pediades]
MSSAIVLPTLTNWAKNHITAIFTATNATDFDSAMNAFLSDKAVITVNGVQTSRADFISQTQGEKFDEIGATVNFAGAVEVPSDPNQPINAGSVGLFFNAVITEGIRVLGAPISHQQTVSLNIV